MANCIFCNQNKVSKEHLWGVWWQDYYPPSKRDHLTRNGHTITIRNSLNELKAEKGLFSNIGDPLGKTTKVVCKNCNNSWMSQIEKNMKNTFHKLFIEKEESILTSDISIIKKWMYLKYFLIDRAYSNQDSLISDSLPDPEKVKKKIISKREENRKNFFYDNKISKEFQFFIARSTAECKIGSFNYIPLFIIIKTNNALDIQLMDTCMFFNGNFIGIVSSNQIINDFLKNNFQDLLILENSTEKFNVIPKISGRELEDSILSKIEAITRTQLRRNFTQ